jgi:hypothetical protein
MVPDMIFLNGVFPTVADIGPSPVCTTMSFAASPRLNSPIVWTWDNRKRLVWFNEGKKTRPFFLRASLQEVLLICQHLKTRRPHLFFFRKVSPTVPIPISFMEENLWTPNRPSRTLFQLLGDRATPTGAQERQLAQKQRQQEKRLFQSALQQLETTMH